MTKVAFAVGLGLLIVLLAVPMGAAQSGGSHFWYVPWKATGPVQYANLTWQSGTGGIAWGAAAHEDNQPPDTLTKADYDQQRRLANLGLATPQAPVTIEFTSAPTTSLMVLNATRTIQFNLFFQKYEGATCPYHDPQPKVSMVLTIGDRILAGANGMAGLGQYVYWYYLTGSFTPPADPTGYFRCFYTMGIEQTIIPVGTVIKLKFTILEKKGPTSLGLAGDHQSFITFPLVPPEEAIFRFPELEPPAADEESEDSDDAPSSFSSGDEAVPVQAPTDVVAPLVGGLGLVVGAALSTRRRRGSMTAVGALVAAAILSGCLAGGPGKANGEQLTGNITNTFIKDQGGLTDGALGSILGQVHDDLHIPVRDVHVSMIGLANFTSTDAKGRFSFLNVLPGTFTLRFDRKDYRSFEAPIEVKAGYVSRPDIMMYLIDPKERDARPHTHDYWGEGVTSVPIMDTRLPKGCPEATCAVQYDFAIPPKEDAFKSIYPGTAEVEVTLDWNPAAIGQSQIGLAIQHNGDKWLLPNSTVYAPRGPNVPFRIQVAWEMTDPGHQPLSTWRFHWFEGDTPYDYPNYITCAAVCVTEPKAPAAPATGETAERWMQAKIVIKKGGALPLEPGHPNRWAAGSIQLFKAQAYQPYFGGGPYYGAPPLPPSAPVCQASPGYCFTQQWYKAAPYLAGSMVPEGAEWIEVTIKQNRVTDPDFGVVLWYKPTNVKDKAAWNDLTGWKSVTAQSGGTWEKRVFKIPVHEGERDYIYAKKSGWMFSLRPDGSDDDVWHDTVIAGGRFCQVTCQPPLYDYNKWLRYTIDASVYNTPM